ncbi:MAG: TM2 domain-containing protein [Bacteroidaceae bacterium]|nr:TM2 domain-containing protein [Bacteroidaceae bacterium]
MDINQANQLLALYGNRLPIESLEMVKNKLLSMDYNVAAIRMTQFKDPTMVLILSVIVGSLGVDRFYIGDVGLGVGKLLTCGGAYIWWLIDIFMIQDAAKRKNFELFMTFT